MAGISDVLKERTMQFAIDILKVVDQLPRTSSGYAVSRQLSRCGTGVGANYCCVRTARSRAEFIAKLGVVVEEAEETIFWLEVISRSAMLPPAVTKAVRAEAGELRAIFAKSAATARANQRARSIRQLSA